MKERQSKKGFNFFMRRILTVTMCAIMLCSSQYYAFASNSEYPYSSLFPDGIEDTDISLFTEREILFPLNSTFETSEETEFIKANNQQEQIKLSEDAYEGKFSLSINPLSEELITLKETDYFSIGKNMSSYNTVINDKNICISGMSTPNEIVNIIIRDSSENIVFLQQSTCDKNGKYSFAFSVKEYGIYDFILRTSNDNIVKSSLTVYDNISQQAPRSIEKSTSPETVNTKTNIIKLWIKPKYKAEHISFYVSAICNGEEKQLRILDSKNEDGIFSVSEELALGRWQQITLDLLKLSENPDISYVKNLYVSANTGSEWVIDSVNSEYREINYNNVNLEQFAKNNVVFTDDKTISFEKNTDSTYNNSSSILTGSLDIKEKISSISVDSGFEKINNAENTLTTTQKTTYYTIPGYSSGVWSDDYKKIFYNNLDDNQYIYCFDTISCTSTKTLEITDNVIDASYTGKKLMTSGLIYDTETRETIPLYENATHYLSPKGEIFAVTSESKKHSYYKYSNGTYTLFYQDTYEYKKSHKIIFSLKSDIFVVCNDDEWIIFENTPEGCTYIKEVTVEDSEDIENYYVSNDGTKIYYIGGQFSFYYCYNINTETHDNMAGDYIVQFPNGKFLLGDRNGSTSYYNIYDEITGKKELLYVTEETIPNYCYERNCLLEIVDGKLMITDLNMNTEHNKYLLSFDGKKTWYSYKNDRWTIASSNPTPSIEEIKTYGMTKEEINSITEDAFGKVYNNGNEVYTLNFAIGMLGSAKNITPVIKSITVNSIANQPIKELYSSKLFTYSKNNYNKIKAVFPVEDFPKASECYYLLYLGNEWVYTYKDSLIKKVDMSADKLIEDISSNWLYIKQLGLSATELRAIPEDVLSSLFVNKEFANVNFGIIAISKVKDYSTMDYNIDIKIIAEEKYVGDEGYVLEISLNGTEKLIFTPDDIDKNQIEDFLAWIVDRQNGNGDIFYRMKTKKTQNFINYYNITNINVYKENDTINITQ